MTNPLDPLPKTGRDVPGEGELLVDVTVVKEMMSLLSKALRASRLYMENNPVYQQAMTRMQGSFAAVWEEFHEIQIEITENALICERQPVLQEENKSESLAFTLFKDGLRTLTLSPGVEDSELVQFLQIVNKAKSLGADAQDDLITLLWEEEFEHLRYHYVELGQADAPAMDAGTGDPVGGNLSSTELADQIREDAAQAEEARQSVGEQASAAELDIRPYFLDRDEIQYLRDEVVREYQQDLRSNVMAMVFDIMELQSDEAIREETMVIIEDFLPHILADGDLGTVGYVLEQIPVVLERQQGMPDYLQERLANIPSRLSDPASVRDLIVYLDSADPPPDSDSLKQFLDELRPEALEAILVVLPSLKNIRLSSALGETIGRLARGNPQQLEVILQSDDRAVVIQVLKLVAKLKIGAAVAAVGAHLNSGDLAIRQAAVTALASVESAGSMMELAKALDDDDRAVRVEAAKAFARTGNASGRSKIEAAVTGKSLRKADLAEKRAFFEAFGAITGPSGIPKLVPLLQGGGFMSKVDPETRACAAAALGRIGSPEARDALEKVSGDKDPLVRNAVAKALKGEG